MPSWAQDDPRDYWDAADLFERANGRPYLSANFAIPRDLEPEDQIALAHAFAQELTADERLPYTLAVHAGHDAGGREHNPHAHLIISERRNDGVERSREQWFRLANSKNPERSGAPKSRAFHGREWMERARGRWAELTNATFERTAAMSVSITAATSARESTGSPANTSAPARRMRSASSGAGPSRSCSL